MSPFFKRGMKGDLVLVSTWMMATVHGYLSNNNLIATQAFMGTRNFVTASPVTMHQRLARSWAFVETKRMSN
jgi:hypothetical protein